MKSRELYDARATLYCITSLLMAVVAVVVVCTETISRNLEHGEAFVGCDDGHSVRSRKFRL
jgi:hypothetical protein